MTRILPAGEIIGWKKAHGPKNDVLVQLRIPAHAKRTHAFGRKCRASEAVVVAIEGAESAEAHYNPSVKYIVGNTVKPIAPFNDDWTQECASGIHFYITKEEAEAHQF